MRRGSDPSFLENSKGEFCGVNLSSDFCSEHEWGIKDLRRDFDIPDEGHGIFTRQIRKIPTDPKSAYERLLRIFQTKGDKWCLAYAAIHHLKDIEAKGGDGDLYLRDKSEYHKEDDVIAGAWDDRTFGVMARDEKKLRQLWDAFQKKDVAIMLGGGQFFSNAGLCLVIISKVEPELLKVLKDKDLDYDEMEKAAKKTGIEAHLKKAGKRWFALSPKWIPEANKTTSKHPVWFWLNPMEQQAYNCGWFTVEELLQWAEDKGPVPMKAKKSCVK